MKAELMPDLKTAMMVNMVSKLSIEEAVQGLKDARGLVDLWMGVLEYTLAKARRET